MLKKLIAILLVSLTASAVDTVHRTDKVKFGKAASGSDKILEADKGSGSTNPKLKFSISDSKWQYSNDGTNYKNVGSAAGSAAPNLITENAGFENNATTNWTSGGSPTTFEITSTAANVGEETYALSFDPSADGDYFETDAYTLAAGYYSRNGVACIRYKGADTNLELNIIDGSSNELVSEALSASTGYTDLCVNFIFPASGSVKLRIEAEGDGAAGYYDAAFIGDATRVNISSTAGGEYYAGMSRAGATNCSYDASGTTLAAFSADSDCAVATYYENATDSAGKIPGFTSTNVQPGNYYVVASFNVYTDTGASGNACYHAVSDGTTTGKGTSSYMTAAGAKLDSKTIIENFTYTTTQSSVTWQVYGAEAAASNCWLTNSDSGSRDFSIHVYRYPLSSQTAVNPSTQMQASGVIIAASSDHRITTTSATYEKATDADIISGDKTHFGSALITATAGDFGYKMPTVYPGTYFVYANARFEGNYSASTTAGAFKIYDGTNDIAERGMSINVGSDFETYSSIIGVVTYTSIQKDLEFTIYHKRDSGGGSLGVGAVNGPVEIGMIPISEGMHMPQILNNVESSASGGVKLKSVHITNSGVPAVTSGREDGDWVTSVDDNGTGWFDLNFTTNFSDAPRCTCTAEHSTVFCSITAASASEMTIYTTDHAGNLQDYNVHVQCIGSK